MINEVYYDHPGADAGHEFIELLNVSQDTVGLAGVTVEFHNGTGEGWTRVWEGGPNDSVASGALFVVGADGVRPLPDAIIGLSLQNGPDALRVVGLGFVDVVGYGGLDDPAYVEQQGAAKVSSGFSIGRLPDGADSDNNASDFIAMLPSPGRYNLPRRDVALELDASTPVRAAIDSPGPIALKLRLRNNGIETIPAGAVVVTLTDSSNSRSEVAATTQNVTKITPENDELLSIVVPVEAGYHWFDSVAQFDGDERPHNDNVKMIRRGGRIDVVVSEVMSAPSDGCPQFVELYNAGGTVVGLGAFSLRDRTSAPVAIRDSLRLAPRSFVVVTADRAQLLGCHRVSAAVVAGVSGSWPTFNRSGGEIADSVIVLDAYGIVVEAVAYPGVSASEKGTSLERVNLYPGVKPVFLASLDETGATPGRAGSRALFEPAVSGEVVATPNPFSLRDGETLQISVDASGEVASAGIRVFDMRGVEVAAPGYARSFPVVVIWDGRTKGGDLAEPGFYIVACEFFAADGSRASVAKTVVACAKGVAD